MHEHVIKFGGQRLAYPICSPVWTHKMVALELCGVHGGEAMLLHSESGGIEMCSNATSQGQTTAALARSLLYPWQEERL